MTVDRLQKDEAVAKEWNKFETEYKRIRPSLGRYSRAGATELAAQMRERYNDAEGTGERHFAESLAVARENGATGTKLEDFVKYRAVADALKAYEISVTQFRGVQDKLLAYAKGAQQARDSAARLLADVEKDLSSRKDKSQTKTQIEGLRDDLTAALRNLDQVAAVYRQKDKFELEYAAKSTQRIQRLLNQSPAGQAASLKSTQLPQAMVDRNRKRTMNQVVIAAKEIIAACDEALAQAGADPAAAKSKLKDATARFRAMSTQRDGFIEAYEYAVAKSSLLESKDADAVKKTKETIDKAHAAAERKLRGVTTTMRKAAV